MQFSENNTTLAAALGSQKIEALSARVAELEWIESPLLIVSRHLQHCINSFRPDLVIVFERKGRALLRALIDETDNERLEWEWSRILSSNLVESCDPGFFSAKRILIFDDTLRTGGSVGRLVDTLVEEKSCRPDQLCISIIGAHSDGNKTIREIQAKGVSVLSYFRNLDTEDFHFLRKSMVDAVRHLGSLLLDTEHAELRFQTTASFREILDALGRNAKTVVFESGRDTKNITVFYGDTETGQLNATDYPKCNFTNMVKKARVLRCAENQYTIIPFCLPAVPARDFAWPAESWQLKLFGNVQPRSEEERFYQVGLSASLEILGWVVKDLAASVGEKITFRYPSRERIIDEGRYDYCHLLPIYPNLCIDQLARRVFKCASENERKGKQLATRQSLAKKRKSHWNDNNYCLIEMEKDSLRLIQCIADEIGRRSADDEILRQILATPNQVGRIISKQPGLRAREVFELGRLLKLENPEVSALFDLLIDNATLVTKIEVQESEGVERCVRTFRPDGEVISGLIRDYTRRNGLPYEIFNR